MLKANKIIIYSDRTDSNIFMNEVKETKEIIFDGVIEVKIKFKETCVMRLTQITDFTFNNKKIILTNAIFHNSIFNKYIENIPIKSIEVYGCCVEIDNPKELLYYVLKFEENNKCGYITSIDGGLNIDSDMRIVIK